MDTVVEHRHTGLWIMIALLVAAVAGMAYYGWATLSDVETRIAAVEERLETDQSRLRGHDTRLDGVEAIMSSVAITLGNQQRDIDAATSAVQGLETRVDDVSACTRSISDLIEGFSSFLAFECSSLPLS
jgi:hypothetical protein